MTVKDTDQDDSANKDEENSIVDEVTPDQQELLDAEAEVKAEEEAKAKAEADTEEKPDAEPDKDSKPEKDEDEKAETPRIPKSRLDEVLDKANRATAENAYLKQRLEALEAAKPEEKEATPPVEDQVSALEAKRDEIWQMADDGELSLSEARKQERALDAEISALQKPEPKPPAPQQDTYFSIEKQKIIAENPAIKAINDAFPIGTKGNDRRWELIEGEAQEAMERDGTPLNPDDPLSKLEYMRKQGEIAARYAPLWGVEVPKPNGQPESNSGKSQAENRKNKLDLADNHPTAIEEMGSTGDALQYTEAQLEAMTDDEIEALPDSIKNKIAGNSFDFG